MLSQADTASKRHGSESIDGDKHNLQIIIIFHHCLGRFVLGMSPSGTCDLLSALRTVFESEDLLFDSDDQHKGKKINDSLEPS